MSSLFDKLNLRPGERRLVIIVGIVLFLIVNFIFVWPEFGKYGKAQVRGKDADNLVWKYQSEVDKTATYQKQLDDLEKQGATVASEEQALKLSSTTYNQAALSGVQINSYSPVRQTSSAKPNQFFEEQSAIINFSAEEKQLVDFLYNLGVGGSLIRVRSMTLNPDMPRQRLQGNLTLVASYAKKAPPKPATPAPAAAAKPATNPGPAGKPNFAAARSNALNAASKTNTPPTK